jgi:threonine dehydrogenase-like Zn-dependent dehydrogenase
MLPDSLAQPMMEHAGIDRLAALHLAIELVQRGGTVSLSGVYGGAASPMPLLQMFDKQISLRMGQANVRRWVDDILPLLTGDDDPLGVDDFATHHLPLADAPQAYEQFQKKEDNTFKVLLKP